MKLRVLNILKVCISKTFRCSFRYVKHVNRRWYKDDDGPNFAEIGGSNIPEEIWTPSMGGMTLDNADFNVQNMSQQGRMASNMGGMNLNHADFNVQSMSQQGRMLSSLKMRQKRRRQLREKSEEQYMMNIHE